MIIRYALANSSLIPFGRASVHPCFPVPTDPHVTWAPVGSGKRAALAGPCPRLLDRAVLLIVGHQLRCGLFPFNRSCTAWIFESCSLRHEVKTFRCSAAIDESRLMVASCSSTLRACPCTLRCSLRNSLRARKKGRKKVAVGGLLGAQPTLELMIAKFVEARTSDFVEPLHGN